MKRPHKISKLIFEIDVPGIDNALEYQNDVSSFIRNEVQIVLDTLLDEHDLLGKVIHIDKLELDLQDIVFTPANMPFLREELRKRLGEQLSEQVAKASDNLSLGLGTGNAIIRDESGDMLRLIIFFFNHGRLPWWTSHYKEVKINDEVQKILDDRPGELISALKEQLSKPHFRKRLVNQLNSVLFRRILIPLSEIPEKFEPVFWEAIRQMEDKNNFLSFLDFVSEGSRVIEEKLAALVDESGKAPWLTNKFNEYQNDPDSVELLIKTVVQMTSLKQTQKAELLGFMVGRHPLVKDREAVEQLLDHSTNPIHPSKKEEPKPDDVFEDNFTVEDDEDHALVQNAGLVIGQPYLSPFFGELGLLRDGQFRSAEAQHHAVYLLHFLATGEEGSPEEHQLLFNKVLCGMDPEEPMNEFKGFSEKEKEECANLLTTLIEHWSALKNTSINGLREVFLKREGHLRDEMTNWTLFIERETPDILLDKLPWGISILKSSWNERMIYVEW